MPNDTETTARQVRENQDSLSRYSKEPARSKAQLKRAVISHMRRLSKLPDRVRSFFGHKTFRYAA